MNKTEKIKVVESAAAVLEKEHGAGSIMRAGAKKRVPLEVISTRVFGVDHDVIGIGGVPRGRMTEVYGPEASGKTTLALQTVAEAQSKGGVAAYIDAEHALDLKYATALGVDVDNLFLSQPDYGEQALAIAEGLINSAAIDILVVDSVAALVPKAELDGEMEDANIGLHARLMSKAMRKLAGVIRKNNVAVIFINQIREKIGVSFGSPETTTGGRALKFYASVRLDIRGIASKKEGEQVIARRTRIKAVKNKVANPYRETEADMDFGKGLNSVGNLLEYAAKYSVIDKAGSWFAFKGERLGQGIDNATDTVKANPRMLDEIKAAVLKEMVGAQ